MIVLRSVGLFIAAGLAEIGGGYLVWQWWRNGAGFLLGAIGGFILVLYGIVPTYQPDNSPHLRWWPVVWLRQFACYYLAAEQANAVDIDLSFADSTRPPHRLSLCVRARDSERNRFRLRRQRRLAPNGNVQSVPKRILG